MFAIVHLYFARCTMANISTYSIKPFRAEILQIFQLLFWKIDDFINSFRLNLTFSGIEVSNRQKTILDREGSAIKSHEINADKWNKN